MAPLARAGCGALLRRAACFFLLCSLLVFCEGCKKVTFNVPSRLDALTLIGRVNVQQCLRISDHVSSSDPDFVVLEDGSVYTTNAISLPPEGKTFTILLNNVQENKQKKIHVALLSHPKKTHKTGETVLRRSKRRWAPVPTTIMENSLGPFPMQIQQLFSDTAQKYNITYSIRGPGVDQPPLNYFYIEKETGNLFVTCPIDREEYAEFKIICYATTADGYTPEIPLVHLIRIEDDNDNAPIFDPSVCTFGVIESSKAGTLIGQVTATDRDEPGTLHTKLKYRITSYQPLPSYGTNLFNINGDTGSITLAFPGLDRETVSEYTLYVEARDMAGQHFGLCNTATVIIQVEDANDHAPMCEHGTYEAYVSENTVGAEVANIGVVDRDAPGTPNWHATFSIIKGNEDGAFKIVKKPDSNVGTLCIEKGLDYEKTKERRLEIAVNNEVPYSVAPGSKAISTSTCYVVVKVRDVDEGPVFDPCVYILDVKECLPAGTVVGRYTARDPETGNSEGIRYQIISDPCKWITMDDMGQIRTTVLLDREAPTMQFYQCNVTVSATDRNTKGLEPTHFEVPRGPEVTMQVNKGHLLFLPTDGSESKVGTAVFPLRGGKTGTGVVVVNLIDENDNFPVIVQKDYVICRGGEPICLTAVDADQPPHTGPFRFEIPERMLSDWTMTQHDDNSVYLEPMGHLPYRTYSIPVRVTDNAGHSGITDINVRVCDCTNSKECDPYKTAYQAPNVTLGLWAILALILGSLLLLLILITLCGCGGSAPVSSKHVCDDLANQNLIISNTEAPGEEVMDPNILPLKISDQGAGMSAAGVKTGQECFEMVKGGQHTLETGQGGGHHTMETVKGGGHHTLDSGRGYGQTMVDGYRYSYSEWQNYTQPRLTEKVYLCGQDEEHKHSEDYVLPYNYEGRGSPAGSIGCCTDQQDEEALDFLDQLEPKFRTLAETCVKR